MSLWFWGSTRSKQHSAANFSANASKVSAPSHPFKEPSSKQLTSIQRRHGEKSIPLTTTARIQQTCRLLPLPHSRSSLRPPLLPRLCDDELDAYRLEVDALQQEMHQVEQCIQMSIYTLCNSMTQTLILQAALQSLNDNSSITTPYLHAFIQSVEASINSLRHFIKQHRSEQEDERNNEQYKTVETAQDNELDTDSDSEAESDPSQLLNAEVFCRLVTSSMPDWEVECSQFTRELQRTNDVRLTMTDCKDKVDRLFVAKCEALKDWSEDEEFQLKLAKSDLEAVCVNYTSRLQSLHQHYRMLVEKRLSCLNCVLFEWMRIQTIFNEPLSRAFLLQQHNENNETINSPSTQQTIHDIHISSSPMIQSNEGEPHYRSSTFLYHSPSMLNHDTKQQALTKSPLSVQSAASTMDSSSFTLSLPTPRSMRRSRQSTARRSPKKKRSELAILEACKQLEVEMSRRLQSEEENAEMKREIEELKRKSNVTSDSDKEALQQLKQEIERLQQQLQSKDTDNTTTEGETEGCTEIPMAPPLDDVIPAAPPLIPDAPHIAHPPAPDLTVSSFAPSAPTLSIVSKQTVRDKEIAEAKQYGLPVLPAVDKSILIVDDQTYKVKRIHWQIVPAANIKGTVWDELIAGKIAEEDNFDLDDSTEQTDDDVGKRTMDLLTATPEMPCRRSIAASVLPPLLEPLESHSINTTNIEDLQDDHIQHIVDRDSDELNGELQWHWPVDREFVQIFAQRAVKSKSVSDEDDNKSTTSSVSSYAPATNKSIQPEQAKIELLDAKRSYNISISLSHFRLSFTQLHTAILQFDSSALDADLIDVLMDCMPTHDEKQLIASYDGTTSQLGHVEQFMKIMSSPDSLHTRLITLSFMHNFSNNSHTIADSLAIVQQSLDSLLQSLKFKTLLGLILRFGNHLNALNNMQQCYGFDLSALHAIRSVKTADNQLTLLHWLVDYVSEHCESVHEFVDDLSTCKQAVRIESAFLLAEMRQLKQRLNVLRQLIEADDRVNEERNKRLESEQRDRNDTEAENGFEPGQVRKMTADSALEEDDQEPIPQHVRQFYKMASATINSLEQQLKQVQDTFQRTSDYLIIPPQAPWESVFQLLTNFMSEYIAAREDLRIKRDHAKQKARQRETLSRIQNMQKGKKETNATTLNTKKPDKSKQTQSLLDEIAEMIPLPEQTSSQQNQSSPDSVESAAQIPSTTKSNNPSQDDNTHNTQGVEEKNKAQQQPLLTEQEDTQETIEDLFDIQVQSEEQQLP